MVESERFYEPQMYSVFGIRFPGDRKNMEKMQMHVPYACHCYYYYYYYLYVNYMILSLFGVVVFEVVTLSTSW